MASFYLPAAVPTPATVPPASIANSVAGHAAAVNNWVPYLVAALLWFLLNDESVRKNLSDLVDTE
jgi:hypothetical protein